MAKKGQQQSFQYEINSDEELFKYIDRKGLVVIDIYSDWCGPCIGMLNNLKKVKLEIGGDNLHLAIAKSDTIETFARFRNRSEPTWLFVIHGKATNIMFGANVPRLTQVITRELELTGRSKVERKTYALNELQPIEVERLEAKRKIEEEKERIEREAEELKRKTYLNYCTGTILDYMAESGISIFGPQINRENLKKILEIAEKDKLSPKDRKLVILEQAHMDIVNYACNNPIDPKVLEQMYGKECLVILWKLAEGETRSIEEGLVILRDALTKSYPDEQNPDNILPPLFPPLEIKIYGEQKLIEVEELPQEHVEEKAEEMKVEGDEGQEPQADEEKKEDGEEEGEEAEKEEKEGEKVEEAEQKEKEIEIQPQPKLSIVPLKTILIPAMWTPGNKKTNAAGIYVFFRNQTLNFLPPDPVPDPPHLIAIYDAYKKREIRDLISKWGPDVLSYGYFSSENPKDARLLANSTKNYEAFKPKAPTDKIIVKISKTTSHCLLAFAKANPSYISENCVVGEEEAKKFFPKSYKTGEQEEAEAAAATKEQTSNKRKSKKKVQDQDVAAAVPHAQSEEEGGTNSPEAQ